jgi:hypothetical protein
MSVMHYGPNGFAIDKSKPTIVTKDPYYQNLIGQAASLTKADNDLLNNLYSFTDEPTLANCTCSRFEFSGFEQNHLNGVYVKDVNGSLVGDKFAYRNIYAHETSANWLYYKRTHWTWRISTYLNGHSSAVRVKDVAFCPENVEKKWEEGGRIGDNNVIARCVDNVSVFS